MPVMDGLQTLDALKKIETWDSCHCIQCNDSQRAKSTFEALAKGAVDYVTKPSSLKKDRSVFETVELQLIPRLKTFGRKRLKRRPAPTTRQPVTEQIARPVRPTVPTASRPAGARFDPRPLPLRHRQQDLRQSRLFQHHVRLGLPGLQNSW